MRILEKQFQRQWKWTEIMETTEKSKTNVETLTFVKHSKVTDGSTPAPSAYKNNNKNKKNNNNNNNNSNNNDNNSNNNHNNDNNNNRYRARAVSHASLQRGDVGWHYLSNATCLIRPHLFLRRYGRFPKFNRVCLGRDPGTLKSDIVSKEHPQLICSDLRLSN